jgi:hypothetical protein
VSAILEARNSSNKRWESNAFETAETIVTGPRKDSIHITLLMSTFGQYSTNLLKTLKTKYQRMDALESFSAEFVNLVTVDELFDFSAADIQITTCS